MNIQEVLPRDAIPSIDEPTFSGEYFGNPDDEVIVVDADPPRADPVRILSYHEIVNDVLDSRPIAVTWCPICWSAVVYERTVNDRTLTFACPANSPTTRSSCTTERPDQSGNSRRGWQSSVN